MYLDIKRLSDLRDNLSEVIDGMTDSYAMTYKAGYEEGYEHGSYHSNKQRVISGAIGMLIGLAITGTGLCIKELVKKNKSKK